MRALRWALGAVLVTLALGGSPAPSAAAPSEANPPNLGSVPPGPTTTVPSSSGSVPATVATTTTSTAPASSATTVPAPPVGGDGGDTFHWDDPATRDAFRLCLDQVDVVAGGSARRQPTPEGFDKERWYSAINASWLNSLHIQTFTYQPHCEVLLPGGWEERVPVRFRSEAYNRCRANVGSNGRAHRRPDAVPAWYWETSLRIRTCWLLLPRGAFGVGAEDNAWSAWTTEDEVIQPDSSQNAAVNEAKVLCDEYIEWRMNGAATFPGLGDRYDEPPDASVPDRVWHEALHYYRDPVHTSIGDRTEPADWRPDCGRLLSTHPCDPRSTEAIVPELCVGPHATSHYDIGYAEADDLDEEEDPSFSRLMWGGATAFAFFLGKSLVHVALWLVGWAYSFRITELNPLARDIGDTYQRNLVNDPVGERLQDLFWLVLVCWAGLAALRGKLAMAGGELLTTIVLLLVAAVLIDHRVQYMNATWTLMTESSNTLLEAGLSDLPPVEGGGAGTTVGDGVDAVLVRGVQAEIHRVFVEDAYDHLNWGAGLGDADDGGNRLRRCAAARYYIVSQGPHSAEKFPRDRMRAAGPECGRLAEFNRNPNGTRLMGAILTMVSSLLVAVLLGLIALTIIVGKFVALLLFAVAPLAVIVVSLPGQGRKVAWAWGSAVVQVVLAVVGMSFLLSLLLMTLVELTTITEGVPLIERFLLMNLVVLVLFAARRNLLAAGQRLAGRLGEYLSATRGSGTSWAAAGAASAGQGLNLLRVDRTALIAVGAPASVAGRHLARRVQERRVARRSYRNLQNISYWKRAENYRNEGWRSAREARNRGTGERPPMRRMPLP
jgi:hypothetical protein